MSKPVEAADSRPLAYSDHEFIESDAARPLRILAEYIRPWSAFAREGVRDTIVFFGSARIFENSTHAKWYHDARRLANLITEWSSGLQGNGHRFLVCSGGGPGLMEAANRGAKEAGGQSIGLNISLPHEQHPNEYITPEFSFEFRYFFMRKLWFAHLAAAAVIFPGGFGTLDELLELLTLSQTRKLEHLIPIILYDSSFWKRVINFDVLVEYGTIAPSDLDLFSFADEPEQAFEQLKTVLKPTEGNTDGPCFAHSRAASKG